MHLGGRREKLPPAWRLLSTFTSFKALPLEDLYFHLSSLPFCFPSLLPSLPCRAVSIPLSCSCPSPPRECECAAAPAAP